VYCWGHSDSGETGASGKIVARPTKVKGVEGAAELALGAHFSCARLNDGTVKCWGSGRLANDGKEHKAVGPTTVEGVKDAEQIEADGVVACVRTKSGGAQCWGGDKDLGVPKLNNAIDVKVAATHACAVLKGGAVQCWGSEGGWGGTGKNKLQKPALKDVQQVISVDGAACALIKGGTVKCWGRNLQGEMGIPADAESRDVPIEVKGVKGATQIMSGLGRGCAVMGDKSVMCWGGNSHGELGRGSTSDWEGPGAVSVVSGTIAEIAFGADHACARTEDNALWCWGSNKLGQLGDGKSGDERTSPKRVGW
jgi:alpha-tubulin suppressor-like RCC1 family protein